MSELPTKIPSSFMIGDSLKWEQDAGERTPAEGWEMTVTLASPTARKIYVLADQTGDVFLVDLDTSTGLSAGDHAVYATVSKAGERYLVLTDETTVLPDLLDENATGYDGRSWIKVTLDAIRATISGKASSDQLEMSINGRSIVRMSHSELIKAEAHFRRRFADERGESSHIKARFTR